jgi:hypothetical protein
MNKLGMYNTEEIARHLSNYNKLLLSNILRMEVITSAQGERNAYIDFLEITRKEVEEMSMYLHNIKKEV